MDQTAQVQKRRVKLGRSLCRETRELSDEKSKAIPYFYGILEERRWEEQAQGIKDSQLSMNDLEAATFENGWLAYMVKAAD